MQSFAHHHSSAFAAVLAFCAVVQGIRFGSCPRKNPTAFASISCSYHREHTAIDITVPASDIVKGLDAVAIDPSIAHGSNDPCRSLQGAVAVNGAKKVTVKSYAGNQEQPWSVVLGAYVVADAHQNTHYELCYDILGESLDWDSCECNLT